MSLRLFSIGEILHGIVDIGVNTPVWNEVVSLWRIRIVSWPIVMVILLLSDTSTHLCVNNVLVSAEMWNKVVNFVSEVLGWMLVLSTTS